MAISRDMVEEARTRRHLAVDLGSQVRREKDRDSLGLALASLEPPRMVHPRNSLAVPLGLGTVDLRTGLTGIKSWKGSRITLSIGYCLCIISSLHRASGNEHSSAE